MILKSLMIVFMIILLITILFLCYTLISLISEITLLQDLIKKHNDQKTFKSTYTKK